jgi:hypothetical protein
MSPKMAMAKAKASAKKNVNKKVKKMLKVPGGSKGKQLQGQRAAPVTTTTLAQHNNQNDLKDKLTNFMTDNKQIDSIPTEKVEAFLSTLNTKESQSLYKKFEAERMSNGQDAKYKDCTKGAGGVTTSKALMKCFVSDKLRLGQSYTSCLAKITVSRSQGTKAEWLSLATVQKRHGDDLQKLVRAKAIQVRRHPMAQDVLQFRDVREYSDVHVTNERGFEGGVTGELSFGEFRELYNKAGTMETAVADFDVPDDRSDDSEVKEDVLDSLWKGKKGKRSSGPVAIMDRAPGGDTTEGGKDLEACSKVAKGDGWEVIVAKASSMHSFLNQSMMRLRQSKNALPKNQLWEKKMVKELEAAFAAADKAVKQMEAVVTANSNKANPAAAKDQLMQAAKVVKECNRLAAFYKGLMS